MHAISIDELAHAKLKSLLAGALPAVKSSHRAEAVARGFDYATNAALLAGMKRFSAVTIRPARFEAYLAAKGWTVRGSVFVAACYRLRFRRLNSMDVPRWGIALVDGEWIGLVLWRGRLARAGIAVQHGAHGPSWLAHANLSGAPLTLFRDEGDPMPERFAADACEQLGYPVGAVKPRGEFIDLGPYLGAEPFPHVEGDPPEYEIFGASSIPVSPSPEECRARRRREIAAGWYASLITY